MFNWRRNDLATFTDTAVPLLGAAFDLKFIIPGLISPTASRNHIRKSNQPTRKGGEIGGEIGGPNLLHLWFISIFSSFFPKYKRILIFLRVYFLVHSISLF